METQIDTWRGPGPSIPTTALLGSLSSPSLCTNPLVLGVFVLLLTLRILESCLSTYCFFWPIQTRPEILRNPNCVPNWNA